jgi:predicted SAM-dependent methyltransferase
MRNQLRHIKKSVKKSRFVVGAVHTARAGALDLKQFYWRTIRSGRIQNYLRANPVRKLQLGSSFTPLEGWLNTDLIPEVPGVVYLDATRRFPFDDNTFDYIASEHMIEHIDYDSGQAMLREAFRVLKPGGGIRIATPDLRVLLGLNAADKTPAESKYIEWIVSKLFPHVADCKAAFVINNAFRCWGHQFLYDAETLKAALARCGFASFLHHKPGESHDTHLRGIESHGRHMGSEDINQFETLVIEARVPAQKTQKTGRAAEQLKAGNDRLSTAALAVQ